jgi:phospholipid/cholesterol/gamma-HCH transport system permease protein
VIAWLGRKTSDGVAYAAEVLYLGFLSLKALFSRSPSGRVESFRVIARQLIFTGVDALPVVTVIALLVGLLVIIEAGTMLPRVGAGTLLADIIVLSIVRELGPLVAAFIVVWRSGTAMATELGNMRVGREIDALEAMGVNLIRFLVMPRVVGAIISLICLTVYFDVVAVLGGFLVAKIKLTIPLGVYVEDIVASLSFADVLVTIIKPVLFGFTIATICSYHGLSVGSSSTEVPQQTTRAMLNTVTICLILDILVTVGFYL